jgi:DNA-directed RNA polymerase subunit H (RpoH/RPB5)
VTKPAHIILSRKNVEALLHMLDHRDKQRPAILKGDGLIVEVQENDEHYTDRTPGVMSWETR